VPAVDGVALAALAQELAEPAGHAPDQMVVAQSVRNRFSGLVTRVVRDTVMAQVEIQAGPHRFVSLLSREATDELSLEPGMLVIAAVKATNVAVELPPDQTGKIVKVPAASGPLPVRDVPEPDFAPDAAR
jgi:molybdopterin-binding protein